MQATGGQHTWASAWMNVFPMAWARAERVLQSHAGFVNTEAQLCDTLPRSCPTQSRPHLQNEHALKASSKKATFLTTAIAAEIGLTEPGVVRTPRSKSLASRLDKQTPTRSPALVNRKGCYRMIDSGRALLSRTTKRMLPTSATATAPQD